MMSLEEAIKHAEYIASKYSDAVSVCWSVKDCEQLAAWLHELQERRKAPEIIRCCECNYWKSGMKYCTHPNGMNSDLDNGFCSMAERRTDGQT